MLESGRILGYLGGYSFPTSLRKFVDAAGTILTERLNFYCPFCSASIEVAAASVKAQGMTAKGMKVKCSGCQRKVEVPAGILAEFPEPDDDDDFLSGVPLKASGDEDILTAADLALESADKPQSIGSPPKTDPLKKEFDFSVADSGAPTASAAGQDDLPVESGGSADAEILETNLIPEGNPEQSKTGADEDLNQLLAGVNTAAQPNVEKGTFAIRCSICDSRLLVSLMQVGKEVKCSDCFSMIKVRPPTEKEKQQIEKQIRLSLEEESSDGDEAAVAADGELTLAPIVEDELDEVEVVAEIVEDDDDSPLVLRDDPAPDPKELAETEPTEDDFADVVFADDDNLPDEGKADLDDDLLSEDLSLSGPLELEDAQIASAKLAPAAKQSGGGGKQKINPYRSKSAQQAEKRTQEKKVFKLKQKPSSQPESKYPELRFDSFFAATVELVTAPKVAVRGFVVAALLAIGNVISHSAIASFKEIDAPTMGDTATMGIWRFGVGWLPYAIGTILLWYFCGVVFRETAGGKKKIKSWKLGPTTEWSSTLLITAISFAIAGSPVLMFMSIFITAPVRFFLALPFLTAVWYAQSPFAIISSDVLVHMRKNGKHWKTVFLVVLALASLAFVAGILMHVPLPWVNVLTSALGAVFLSFVTLAFAAVAGWHSGMVVEQLN